MYTVAMRLIGFVYRFIVGKSATPFYYIVVLVQLTVITPWLIKIVKQNGIISRILWLVTPVYLVYLYTWNYIVGASPRLYETLFPAWFGFYYLGIQVRCGWKLIGWLLKKNESNCSICRLLSKIGDCSYGIFYIHMAVLMIVGRIIECENWYAYWALRFVLTSFIRYIVVHLAQMALRNNKKLLRYIGFV